MKQRAARHRDRGLMVNRGGAWGAVLYVRKRAYYWGHHCPVDALGISRTAAIHKVVTAPTMHYSVKAERYPHLVR